jgi:hypothetical protein
VTHCLQGCSVCLGWCSRLLTLLSVSVSNVRQNWTAYAIVSASGSTLGSSVHAMTCLRSTYSGCLQRHLHSRQRSRRQRLALMHSKQAVLIIQASRLAGPGLALRMIAKCEDENNALSSVRPRSHDAISQRSTCVQDAAIHTAQRRPFNLQQKCNLDDVRLLDDFWLRAQNVL